MRLTRKEFEALVKRAVRRIPQEFRRHLRDVAVVVRDRPGKRLMRELEIPEGDDLFGYYEGTPLTERSVSQSQRYPDAIYLFKRPLEGSCETRQELEEEIEITVRHELGHYLGIEEERLAELGYE
jgi:predicted Zn-dependent protease with MMP-like domain